MPYHRARRLFIVVHELFQSTRIGSARFYINRHQPLIDMFFSQAFGVFGITNKMEEVGRGNFVLYLAFFSRKHLKTRPRILHSEYCDAPYVAFAQATPNLSTGTNTVAALPGLLSLMVEAWSVCFSIPFCPGSRGPSLPVGRFEKFGAEIAGFCPGSSGRL